MFRVTRELTFCYGHRLLQHAGKCRHLHGHNGRVLITLETAALDAQGMVVDFAVLKQVVGGWLDETFDHRLILQEKDPLVGVLRSQGEVVVTLPDPPTAEVLAKNIFDYVYAQGFPVVEVILWETPSCYAAYRRPPGERGASAP
jgi:6-pyruvoyltetrahydropterin/6-carboxytetrahydropterin synthase